MRIHPRKSLTVLAILALFLVVYGAAQGGREVAPIPINDLGGDTYLGFAGGLYPGGSNNLPAAHAAEGQLRADLVQPRNAAGQPDPNGKYILLSIGMSNVTQEFCGRSETQASCNAWSFTGQAEADPVVEKGRLAIIDGAVGGAAAASWDDPLDADYDRIRDDLLLPQGLSEEQVQVVWMKAVNMFPDASLPDSEADAYSLLSSMGKIMRALKQRYPNLQQVFISSRIFAGYANTPLNPEPFAYESGFAVKWLIEAQINQVAGGGIDPRAGDLDPDSTAAWIAWGPYLWADGLSPRSDGLVWTFDDFQQDGTHPSMLGEAKVGAMLLEFFKTAAETSPWFLHPDGTPAPTPTPTATPTGLPGEGLICRTVGLQIPDNNSKGVQDIIQVWAGPPVGDVDIYLSSDHARAGDLRIILTHLESGRSAVLADRPGAPPNNNACGHPGFDAWLDDEAASAVNDACSAEPPAISGDFRPDEPLFTFDGLDLWGSWRLTVIDRLAGSSGSFQEWCLRWRATSGSPTATPTVTARPPEPLAWIYLPVVSWGGGIVQGNRQAGWNGGGTDR